HQGHLGILGDRLTDQAAHPARAAEDADPDQGRPPLCAAMGTGASVAPSPIDSLKASASNGPTTAKPIGCENTCLATSTDSASVTASVRSRISSTERFSP